MRRSDARCASGSFFAGNGRESTAPGRVSGPGRRTVQFFWAIRRPSTRTMRTRIAACSPKDAVAVPSLAATPACLATWAGGLLFGGDGVTGLRFRHARGCLPPPRDRLGRHDSPGFDQGLCSVPSCPANVPKVPRGCRTAASGCHLQPSCVGLAHPSRFAPVARPFERVAQSVPAGCISPAIRDTRGSRGTWTLAAASYGCRARAGLPPAVCRPVCRASPPDNVAAGPQIDGVRLHPAPRRHQKRMFSSLAAIALQRRLAPRHYRDFAWREARSPLRFRVVPLPIAPVVTGARAHRPQPPRAASCRGRRRREPGDPTEH